MLIAERKAASSEAIGLAAAVAGLKLSPVEKTVRQKRQGRLAQPEEDDKDHDGDDADDAFNEEAESESECPSNEVFDSDEEINGSERKTPGKKQPKNKRKGKQVKAKAKAKAKSKANGKASKTEGEAAKPKRPFGGKDSFLHGEWLKFRDEKLKKLKGTMQIKDLMKHIAAECLCFIL